MNCSSCNDTCFVDIRLPYKDSKLTRMIDYNPLFIMCPSCAKEYKCPKCDSKTLEFKFLKMHVDSTVIINCKDCGHKCRYDENDK